MSDDFSFKPSYLASEIHKHFRDKDWWEGRFQHRINIPVQQKIRPPSAGTNVLQEDWDILIVLDACRADLFFEVTGQSDKLLDVDQYSSVKSNASMTPEWLKRTFGDSHGDVVYVAGNPMVTRHHPNSFHKLVEAWQDGYDQDRSIIDPDVVTEQALDAREKFPNKRLIIHYMQPHYPFINRPQLNFAKYDFEDVGLENTESQNDFDSITSVWEALSAGLVNKEEVWEGYKHNLNVVLSEVETLLNDIDDRRIVTSDHGNMLGGRNWPIPVKTYGHPRNLRHRHLIQVPWAVAGGDRREIIKEGTSSSTSATNEEVRDRLSNMGYAQ